MVSIPRAKFDRRTQIIGSGLELWSELGSGLGLELSLRSILGEHTSREKNMILVGSHKGAFLFFQVIILFE